MKEKGRFLKIYRGTKCLNCGVPLDTIDKYCHNCGQLNTTKKISLKDFFGEFFASVFSYDSRLAHTINALLFKPGKISKEYIEGKRAKYANPFRFYFSVSIIFFVIFGFSSDSNNPLTAFSEGLSQGLNKNIDRDHNESFNIITETDTLTSTSLRKQLKLKKEEKHVYFTEKQLDTLGFFKAIEKRLSTYDSHYTKTKEKSSIVALDSLYHKNTAYNRYLYNRSIKAEEFLDNPFILFKYIFDHLPFIIFFFLPFLAASIWLLYLRGPHTYMEHLVFTFHTQTMFFILLGIGILLATIFKSATPASITTLVFLFYLYKSMRKFYKQKRLKTIVKFLLVNILFSILASIGSILTLLGSMFFF